MFLASARLESAQFDLPRMNCIAPSGSRQSTKRNLTSLHPTHRGLSCPATSFDDAHRALRLPQARPERSSRTTALVSSDLVDPSLYGSHRPTSQITTRATATHRQVSLLHNQTHPHRRQGYSRLDTPHDYPRLHVAPHMTSLVSTPEHHSDLTTRRA